MFIYRNWINYSSRFAFIFQRTIPSTAASSTAPPATRITGMGFLLAFASVTGTEEALESDCVVLFSGEGVGAAVGVTASLCSDWLSLSGAGVAFTGFFSVFDVFTGGTAVGAGAAVGAAVGAGAGAAVGSGRGF